MTNCYFRNLVLTCAVNLHACSWYYLYVDIDECANKQDDCDKNAACSNLPGTFRCDCAEGNFGDGKTCIGKDHEYCI